jgi:hypothetical protein
VGLLATVVASVSICIHGLHGKQDSYIPHMDDGVVAGLAAGFNVLDKQENLACRPTLSRPGRHLLHVPSNPLPEAAL